MKNYQKNHGSNIHIFSSSLFLIQGWSIISSTKIFFLCTNLAFIYLTSFLIEQRQGCHQKILQLRERLPPGVLVNTPAS